MSGMWILHENLDRPRLRSYEHASFAVTLTASIIWTIVCALWHWKSEEEFALAHK